jgi:group I intron endonuclease
MPGRCIMLWWCGRTIPSQANDHEREMSKSLIYVGRCYPTNKVYVGSTLQGRRRALSHVRDLKTKRHSNDYLQNAWNKYGEDSFKWFIVEKCTAEELKQREQWWIDFLRAADPRYGFNLCNAVQRIGKEAASQLSLTQIEKWRDPVIRSKRLTGLKASHKDPEWKSNRARTMAARWADPAWRAKMLKVLAANTKNTQERERQDPSLRQHRMRGL